MTGQEVHELALTAVVVLASVVLTALFALLVHWSWVAKERLLTRLAARLGVPYTTRTPWWIRWVNR